VSKHLMLVHPPEVRSCSPDARIDWTYRSRVVRTAHIPPQQGACGGHFIHGPSWKGLWASRKSLSKTLFRLHQ